MRFPTRALAVATLLVIVLISGASACDSGDPSQEVPRNQAFDPQTESGTKTPSAAPFGTAPSLGGDKEAVKSELARLQGRWSVVSIELESAPVELDAALSPGNAMLSPIIQGGTWMEKKPNKEIEAFALLKIDPSTDPKQINLISADRTEDSAGIYKLEGDILTLCYTVDKNTFIRPTRFATKKDIPVMLCVYKRDGNPVTAPQGVAGVATDPQRPAEPKPSPEAKVPPASPPGLPDLVADNLAKLNLDQLKTIADAYKSEIKLKFDLADLDRRRPSVVAASQGSIHEINSGLLRVKVQLPPSRRQLNALIDAESAQINEIVRLNRNIEVIGNAIINKLTPSDNK